MRIVIICSTMNWTYLDYANNPYWFNELLEVKMSVDAKEEKRESDKLKRQSKSM